MFLGEDFNTPRALIPEIPHTLHKTAHVLHTFAGITATITRILEQRADRLRIGIIQLDPENHFRCQIIQALLILGGEGGVQAAGDEEHAEVVVVSVREAAGDAAGEL